MNPSKIDVDPRILGQLLAAQSVHSIFSSRQKMGEFVCRAVEGVPGVASAAACLSGAERLRLGGEPVPECADCDVPEGDVDHDPGYPCRLSSRAGIQIFPLRTQDRHFGFLLLKLEERERYAPYEPFVGNLANSLAVDIERQWQKERLKAANIELQRHGELLEELVRERTTELQLGLEREHHLNAVLRSIRNVNQLIVREKDRERLLQQTCGILAETRGLRCVWIVCLGADARVEAMAEAGIGPAFVGLRSQLERGKLPECCRRALTSEGPVVLANPVVNCAACPMPPQYRGTAGMAAALRYGGKSYGVLVVALPAELADDAGELSLVGEVASDIAFALYGIELERQHKRAEETLRESEEKHRLVVDNASEAIVVLQDGTLRLVNPALVAVLGFSEQELKSAPFPSFVHPDDRAMVVERQQKRVRGEAVPARYEFRLLTKDGNARWVEANEVGLEWEGRPATLGLVSDITERKRAEHALDLKNQILVSVSDYSQTIAFAPPEQLFATIVTRLKEITGAAEVLINDYDEERAELVLRQSTLSEEANTWVRKQLGGKLAGFKTPVSQDKYDEIVSSAVGRVGSLHEVTFGAIPKQAGQIMERMLGFGWFVGLALKRDERLVGTIMIAGKKGSLQPENEELLAYASVTANMLARRRAELALVQSEVRLREAQKLAHVGVWDWTIDNDSVAWTEELYLIAGLDPMLAAPTYSKHFTMYTLESRMALKTAVERAIETGKHYQLELELIRPDGDIREVKASGAAKYDDKGLVTGLYGTVQDITERKRAEEALRLKNFVFDASMAANSVADLNGVITEANEAFVRVWGYPGKDEVVGKPLPHFINDPNEAVAIVAALDNTGRWEGDYSAKKKDGSTFIAHGLATTVKDEQGKVIGYQSAVLDVTEQREGEKALERHRDHLEQLVAGRTADLKRSEERFRTVADFTYG